MPAPDTVLDETDHTILGLLQEDARISMKQIAAAVNLSPSSVYSRVKQLRDAGVILGVHAEVDPDALGVGLEALFLIELTKHKRATVDDFLAYTMTIPEVRAAYLITGRHDLVVHVCVHDTAELKDLALDHFTSRPAVTRIETAIIFESHRQHRLPRQGRAGRRGRGAAAPS